MPWMASRSPMRMGVDRRTSVRESIREAEASPAPLEDAPSEHAVVLDRSPPVKTTAKVEPPSVGRSGATRDPRESTQVLSRTFNMMVHDSDEEGVDHEWHPIDGQWRTQRLASMPSEEQ